ncbi:putative NB-ARC and Ankyrin domain [Rosellinia necatrix]|uniref:Putative NB-ARC and Ankyrin domain n=1 Tax=Rosellinia necatrix TaxID=77044 RepID=A0A1W2TK00_ROSNE|nr:putative NB-ARC and Ankyrin domain [Rosellinia necatrix]
MSERPSPPENPGDMERMAKRPRLAGFPRDNICDDSNPAREGALRYHDPNHPQYQFGGCGIQNAGNFEVHGNVNINNNPGTSVDVGGCKALLDSLRFDQMDIRKFSIKKAHARTCSWFLKTSEYTNWMRRDASDKDYNFLWMKGKPGAGKSTLMKFLLEQLQKQVADRELLISFFFNARGYELEKSTIGLYRSLLLQLLEARPDLQRLLAKAQVGHPWTIEYLEYLFKTALQGLGDTPLTCLIDALDECEEKQIRDMVAFLSDSGDRRNRFRVCFASRHYPHITIPTGVDIILEAQNGHGEDIASYLDNRLIIKNGALAKQIRQDIREKASGVFMWVVLVVDILNKEYDAGRMHLLRARIQSLPENLHDLFLNILTRDNNDVNGLILCIQWVLFAERPLKPKELYFAILSGIDPQNLAVCHSDYISDDPIIKRYILNQSKGLTESTISKDSKDSTIQFIHESVRDFLLKDNGLGKICSDLTENLPGQSHNALRDCCRTYMDMEAIAEPEASSHKEITEKFPFLEYANRGILYHADQAQHHNVCQQSFLRVFPRPKWVKHHNIIEKHKVRRYTSKISLLYILAEAGMPALIRSHPGGQSCFHVEDERYGLPILAAAAKKKREAILAMFDLESEQLTEPSRSNLYDKVQKNAETLFHYRREFKFHKKKDMLHQLIEYGGEGVSLLFFATRECDINVKNQQGETALTLAVKHGFIALLDALILRGADISVINNQKETQLYMAIKLGHTEAVKLLLDNGADITARNNYDNTPLHKASEGRDIEVVKLLLDNGADISAVNCNGNTPLHKASEGRYIEVVKLLLDNGADISAVNYNGNTPLHEASEGRYIEVAKLLLDNGANISALNNDGSTPLHMAGSDEIAKLLIDRGADISALNNDGNTPLHTAWSSGIAKLFIDRGADMSALNNDGNTPLHTARYNAIASLFISHGADISALNSNGNTPLHTARSDDIARILINRGADISALNNNRSTPLHMARSDEIAKLLINRGADISALNNNRNTPLHTAQYNTIANLLISHGADISALNSNGNTPLHTAQSYYIAKLLINHGANISALNNNGNTPLHTAWSSSIAKLLVDHGADISALNNDGNTPLHTARSDDTARILIACGASTIIHDHEEIPQIPAHQEKR